MLPAHLVRFRAFLAAALLSVAMGVVVYAADSRQNPLLGATREQVMEKLGEPRNTIVAGNREVLLFDRERVTLRDNVVIQVERLAAEPVRRPPPVVETPAAAPASGSQSANDNSTGQRSSASTTEADTTANATSASTGSTRTNAAPAAPAAPDPAAPLAIKAVRSAGTASRTAPKAASEAATPTASTAVAAPSNAAKAPAAKAAADTPAASAAKSSGSAGADQAAASSAPAAAAAASTSQPVAAAAAKETAVTDAAAKSPESAPTPEAQPTAAPGEEVKAEGEATEKQPPKKTKAKARRKARPVNVDEELDEPVSYFTGQTYVIAFFTIGGGIAYLIWRSRQRQLELAATAVSQTPFTAAAGSTGTGAIFAADFLAKLEWKKFEELVAAYYSKTGVVAVRTKAGPDAPVNIKISWKGEPRPFACVQCISNPNGLVEATQVQGLVTVLAAEDIRRGYVVTNGKFSVQSRDLAEEKHITLLPGDIFLEKLNALPDAARNEIMQEISTGDLSTPTCPKCDVKMVRADDQSWRCANSPKCEAVLPARKA